MLPDSERDGDRMTSIESTVAQTDEQIVDAVLNGDKEAFGLLVDRYSARLLGLAFHLCGDYETALDLTQDTFVDAYSAPGKFARPQRLRPLGSRNPAKQNAQPAAGEPGPHHLSQPVDGGRVRSRHPGQRLRIH